MTLRNDCELANTRRKLRVVQEGYEEARTETDADDHLRELEMDSLKRLINQFKEEIARYEAHQATRPQAH